MKKTSRIRQHAKRVTFICLGIAIAAALTPYALSSSTEDCRSAWDSSDAKGSCEVDKLSWFNNRQVCRIQAGCLNGNGSDRTFNTIEVSVDDAYELKNCDGELKVSSCD